MQNIRIPGMFWVALILGITPIIQQFFGEWYYTAAIVLLLNLIAKLVEEYIVKPRYTILETTPQAAPAAGSNPAKHAKAKARAKSYLFD